MARRGRCVCTLLLICSCIVPVGLSQAEQSRAEALSAQVRDQQLILMRGAAFDPATRVPDDMGLGLSAWRDQTRGQVLAIVQFDSRPTRSDRARLSSQGLERLYYIPNNAYLVRLDLDHASRLSQLPGVRAVFRLPKWAKVDDQVLSSPADGDGRVALEVQAAPGRTAEGIANMIDKRFPDAILDTDQYHHERGRLIARIPSKSLVDAVDRLAGSESVLAVERWIPKQLLNDDSIWVGQTYDTADTTNYALSAKIWNQGIYGDNQIVCVSDSGLDSDMCYFRYDGTAGSKTEAQYPIPPDIGTTQPGNKVIAYYVQPGADAYDYSAASYHGTHVTGSVAGDNWATPSSGGNNGHDNGDGMAPRAQIIMQDVGLSTGGLNGLAGDLSDMFQQAYDAGARIHSDSWGNTESSYDAHSMDMDEFMFRNQDFLFVVAMGNSGTAPGDGSIGAPATAKDIVSVGATTNGGASSQADNLKSYSRGPVDDGRLKPDIVSPGSSINSAAGTTSNTDDNCSSKTMSGTSMATPTTSGYLALLRQYFTDGFYPSGSATPADARTPSGALMKAVLTVGAMPLEGTDEVNGSSVSPIPSLDQGWGRTHLDDSLFFAGDGRQLRVWDVWHEAGIATGEEIEYPVNINSSAEALSVRLVWSDPESTTLATVNLVNNLDLEVVAPDGSTTYLGNVFSGGSSTTGGSADVLNPIEGVVIDSPATGTWTLRIKGTSVPGTGTAPYSDRQGFALAATFASCGTSVSAPTGLAATDNPPAGVDLSWNSSGGSEYLVFRAPGLSPEPEDFALVGTSATTSYTDSHVQGGYDYTYRVRATDGCSESPFSNSSSVTYTGPCTLSPDFSGVETVTNDLGSILCDLVVEWTPGTSSCPAGNSVSYNVYRGYDPYFIPAPGNLVANVSGTSFTDYDVAPMETTYYVVRAEDSTSGSGGPSNGGNQESNTVMVASTPWASTTSPGTFTDDGGDTNAKLALDGEWRVTNQENHSAGGSFSYHNAPDGATHGAGQCAAATTPPLDLQAGSPQLSYWTTYNVELNWDGVVVEVNDCNPDCGSGNWTISDPISGYPGSFSETGSPPVNACSYPSTQGCFNGPSGNGALTGWTQYSHDLSAWAGQTVQIRWNFSSDGGFEVEGFYLDDIEVTLASVNDDCSTKNGRIRLDADSYTCDDTITVDLGDSDLTGEGTHIVTISSDDEPGGEQLTLNESPAGSGAFSGTIETTSDPAASDDLLSISDSSAITVTYVDADDGLGGTNVVKTDTAVGDCQGPVISNVSTADLTANTIRVLWDTDEEADSTAMVGLASSLPPSASIFDATDVTSHELLVQGLVQCTDYAFQVASADPAGNETVDDNGGSYYLFQTPLLGNPTYESSDTPLAISDSTTFTSTITVPASKSVIDVDVQVDIDHTFDGDLDIYLISPAGTRVELSTDNGSTGDDFDGTIFDDEAATSIASGSAPFSGSYRPEGLLSALDGENSAGDWQLEISDDASGDTGSLNWWKLSLTFPFQSCGPLAATSGHTAISDGCGLPTGGDSIWDPGDQVRFSLTLLNSGSVPLTNVSATITPLTSGVTMLTGSGNFDDIAVDGNSTSESPHFVAELPYSAICGSEIEFQVDITTDQGNFQDTISHVVGEIVSGDFTLVDEDFDGSWGPNGDNPPAGWEILDYGDESSPTWNENDWHSYSKGGEYGSVARVYYSPTENQDEHLISPSFDIPAGATDVNLEFDHYYHDYDAADFGYLDINSDQLGVWTNLATYSADTLDMAHETFSLNSYIGHTNVRVRFRYVGYYGWSWQVDNVVVAGTQPGGCNSTQCLPDGAIFLDDFENQNTDAWSVIVP